MWTQENRSKYNRDHLRYPSDLTDDEWAYVEPLIPPAKPGGGKRRTDMRAVMRTRLGNPPGKSESVGDAMNWETLLIAVPEGTELYLVSED